MPEPRSHPGVHVEEIPGGVRSIEGVATSIALFAGWTPRGPIDAALQVFSFTDFERGFGGLDARSLVGHSVQHFFANGGRTAWITRIAASRGGPLASTGAAFSGALLKRFGPGSATTTQADIAQGIVNVVVGFAPLKPAEFVILRIRAAGRPTEHA